MNNLRTLQQRLRETALWVMQTGNSPTRIFADPKTAIEDCWPKDYSIDAL